MNPSEMDEGTLFNNSITCLPHKKQCEDGDVPEIVTFDSLRREGAHPQVLDFHVFLS